MAFVVGVGISTFTAPSHDPRAYLLHSKEALVDALADAKINVSEIDAAVAGHVYGESMTGTRCLLQVGISGIPVVNVSSNCSTGSSALFVARRLIQSKAHQCVIVLGVEQMQKGKLTMSFNDREAPVSNYWDAMWTAGAPRDVTVLGNKTNEFTENVIRLFGEAQIEHRNKFGSSKADYAAIAHKNLLHGGFNVKARTRLPKVTVEQILKAPHLYGDLTSMMSCPMADGAAVAIVCSEAFIRRHPQVAARAVAISGQSLVTDTHNLSTKSFIALSGAAMARRAADEALAEAKLSIEDVDVVEVHDCFASSELILYEALRIASLGQDAVKTFEWTTATQCALKTSRGKKIVVNAGGGLHSRGHPIGASGLAQCHELVTQLRRECRRTGQQVPYANVALQHNYGIGSACVVTVYSKPPRLITSKL